MAESKTTDYAAIYEKEIGTNLPSLHFKGGFNCAVDVLWPEIERLRNEIESTNALFVKHSREYQDQVADLERKLGVAVEGLKYYAMIHCHEDFSGLHENWACWKDAVPFKDRPEKFYGGERARKTLREIEGEK